MEAVGTALPPFYKSAAVQSVLRRAVDTMSDGDEQYESTKQAAQDVLDLLYTCMLFKVFTDMEPPPATVVGFPG
jgi:hypothetical protein